MAFSKDAEGKDGLKNMTNIELSILLWIQENLRGAMDGFWKFITSLGDGGWLWIVVGVGLLFFKKTRVVGFTLLIALLINMFITNLTLKDLFARPRPYTASEKVIPLIEKLSSYSFPSGHTSVSFSGALVLYRMMPKKVGVPALILAAMIGFSRLYVGVHYPTDVLGGVIVGIIASTASYYLIQFIMKKNAAKKGVA